MNHTYTLNTEGLQKIKCTTFYKINKKMKKDWRWQTWSTSGSLLLFCNHEKPGGIFHFLIIGILAPQSSLSCPHFLAFELQGHPYKVHWRKAILEASQFSTQRQEKEKKKEKKRKSGGQHQNLTTSASKVREKTYIARETRY